MASDRWPASIGYQRRQHADLVVDDVDVDDVDVGHVSRCLPPGLPVAVLADHVGLDLPGAGGGVVALPGGQVAVLVISPAQAVEKRK